MSRGSRMGQPISVSGLADGEPVLLQNRDACLDALVTDIHGRTGHKTLDLIAGSAAERTAQSPARAAGCASVPSLANRPISFIHDSRGQNSPRASSSVASREHGAIAVARQSRAADASCGALLVLVLLEELLARDRLVGHLGELDQEVDHLLLEDRRPHRCQRTGILAGSTPRSPARGRAPGGRARRWRARSRRRSP